MEAIGGSSICLLPQLIAAAVEAASIESQCQKSMTPILQAAGRSGECAAAAAAAVLLCPCESKVCRAL